MIFNRSSMSSQPKKPVQRNEGLLYPVLNSDQLLSQLTELWWVNQIKEFTKLPEEHFERLYLDLIKRFAEFVQVLPSGPGGKLGGLLGEGLQRSFVALKVLYSEKNDVDPLFAYALFSATLLVDIGKVVSLHKIMLCDDDGNFVADWLPFKSSMLGVGELYKIRQYGGGFSNRMQQYAASLLAKIVMPEVAFHWLAENTQLFYLWLALLNDDEKSAGALALYFQLAKQDELMNEMNLDKFLVMGEVVTPKADPKHQAGEDFLHWLKEGIESGKISVNENDSNVFVVPEGVFLSVDIFKDFVGMVSRYRDYTVVAQQFNYMGLAKLSGSDFKYTQYFSETPQTKSKQQIGGRRDFLSQIKSGLSGAAQKMSNIRMAKEGVLVKDPGLLFVNKATPDVSKQAKASGEANLPKLDEGQAIRAGFRPSVE